MSLTTRPTGLGHGVYKDAIVAPPCLAEPGISAASTNAGDFRLPSVSYRDRKDYAAEAARLIKPWASVEPADRLPRPIGMPSVMP